MPMAFFSDIFCDGTKGHRYYDFVDVNLEDDNKLFIDPVLISLGSDPWCNNARKCIDSFFDCLYKGFQNDTIQDLLAHAHEQNATKLGYGNGNNGKGATAEGLDECLRDLKKLVQQIPTIDKCEDLSVFIKGFAEDRMSDLLTNILHQPLNEFTSEQMKKLGIAPSFTSSFYTWSIEEKMWKEVTMQSWAYRGKELLLVPKWIVRKNYLFKAHQYLTTVIIERIRINQSKEDFPKREIWKTIERNCIHWEYDYVTDYSKEHPDALSEYHQRIPAYYNRANGHHSDEDLDFYIYGKKLSITA